MNIETQDITISRILVPDEMHLGTCLIMDSHTDIICVKKHASIESIVDVMRVNSGPFYESIGKLSDLTIVNVIYIYDINDC